MKTEAIRECIGWELSRLVAKSGRTELTAIEAALTAKDEALRVAARLMEQGQYMCLDDDAMLDAQEKVNAALSPLTDIDVHIAAKSIRETVAALDPAEVPEECEWVQEDPFGSGDSCIWQTECGHEFVFDEGTPSENGAKWCLYCGKKLVERVVENDE